jgi:hypothetical protein
MLTACASDVSTRPVATGLQAPPAGAPAVIRLSRDVPITLSTGYQRKVWARSGWRLVGGISEGAVYQPIDGIFTVEGAHVHEAYLVIAGRSLVGFYLPVERAFAPLTQATTLPTGP